VIAPSIPIGDLDYSVRTSLLESFVGHPLAGMAAIVFALVAASLVFLLITESPWVRWRQA
jgi:hypothetical protein